MDARSKRVSLTLRLRRAHGALAWALRVGPREALKEREWLVQELLLRPRPRRGPGLWRVGPAFREANCRPLIDPAPVPAAVADHMRADDVVLGAAFGDESRAYPWWIMDGHHVANDIVGGQRLVIVLCEMCSTGIALDPVVRGRRLTFGQGHEFNGTVALEDRETRSVWSPYLAKAIRGPLAGERLSVLAVSQMSWELWHESHPETTVLADEPGGRTGHGSDHEIGGPPIHEGMREGLARWDDRLPHNTLVLGVVSGDLQRAYPLDLLRGGGGVVSDRIGDLPVVVLLRPGTGSYAALAFSRTVADRELTFRGSPAGPIDEETGTRWTFEGKAVDGPLGGERLAFVTSHVGEWYIWAAHFPGLEIAS